MSASLIPPTLMTLGALLVSGAGVALSRRGQKDTHEQQQAANQLQERVNTVDELNDVIEQWKARVEDLTGQVERLQAEKTRAADWQAARCQVQIDRLIENVATLQSIVSDEIARAAAHVSVRDAQDHEASDHDRTWSDDEPRY